MIVAFSVAPSGQPADANHLPGDADTASVHRAVAAAVAVVRASGLPHRTSSMFTEIEGEWDEVMEVCLLYTSPSPRDRTSVRMPSFA